MIEKNNKIKGFSLIELMIAMTILLVLMGVAASLFAGAMGTRTRESRKTDALTSATAALNIISREISNSGYGLNTNGIVTADSNGQKIHFRANITNGDYATDDAGEDITYFFDTPTQSIVRYDPHNANGTTSVIVNRISSVAFLYYDYVGSSSTATSSTTPSNNTGRVTITVTVRLEEVQGQPKNQTVTFKSDVTIRNSAYMLNQY